MCGKEWLLILHNFYSVVPLDTFTCIISLETHINPGRYAAWRDDHPTDGLRESIFQALRQVSVGKLEPPPMYPCSVQ